MNLTSKLTAILVDDEPKAIKNLSILLEKHCPNIIILTTCANVDEAIVAIEKHLPAVVFLDIEMPNKSGFELLEETSQKFQTIFVTAYDEYAIKAFEVSAVDYLLKPVDISRLKQAVEKLSTATITDNSLPLKTLKKNIESTQITQIIVPFKDTKLMIPLTNIFCIKANQSYSFIYCYHDNELKSYTYSKPLSFFVELLSENTFFFRTHRSWLVNVKKIISLNSKTTQIQIEENITAQISKNKIKDLQTIIESIK